MDALASGDRKVELMIGPLYEQYCGLDMNNEQLAALLEPQKRVSAVDFDSVRPMWDFLDYEEEAADNIDNPG